MKKHYGIISTLKADLIEYKQVVLLEYKSISIDLLLSMGGFKETIFYSPCYNMLECKQTNIRILTDVETEELIKLYHLYEFSDRFKILADSENYGGLINLFRTGILSENELYDALLTK